MSGLLADVLIFMLFFFHRNEKVTRLTAFKSHLSRLLATKPSLAAVKNLKYHRICAREQRTFFLLNEGRPLISLPAEFEHDSYNLNIFEHAIGIMWKFPSLLKEFPFPC